MAVDRLAALEAVARARPPAGCTAEDVDAYLAIHRGQLLGEITFRDDVARAGRVVLIACSASKAAGPGPMPPRQLYTGQLFRSALAYAEARGLPWAVLSALHGLLPPWTSAAPYERKLTRRDGPGWAARVVEQLDDLGLPGPTWELHAGELYAAPLAALLAAVEQPLQGLQIGQRLAWYAARRTT